MNRFGQFLRSRSALRWTGRSLLIVAVLAGVIAMHALSEHDDGGGHEMALIAPNAAAMAMTLDADQPPAADAGRAGPLGGARVMPAPMGDPMSGSMAECILFLAAGIGLALLVWRTLRRAHHGDSRLQLPTGLRERVQRGPPGPRPPRISLCLLRV